MDELSTIDRSFYPGTSLPIYCRRNETFTENDAQRSRYKLIMIHDGSGIIDTGFSKQYFISPACFCLSETEHLILKTENHVSASSLYFHPSVLNSIFEFDTIRNNIDSFPLSSRRDLYLLNAFTERSDRHKGQIHPGHNSLKRIISIYNDIDRELTYQDSNLWPCKSRSFLIELLFLIMKIYQANPAPDHKMIQTSDEDIERVLMYLHHNYQNDISVSDLVRLCDINRTTLAERFSRETGFSIKAYLNKLRINIAMTMIHDTSLPIQEIAYRTGFNDITHFGRIFKKITSHSPSGYRNLSRIQ
jgi:AraC family L-rhamnose operon regulatory protein RhaS